MVNIRIDKRHPFSHTLPWSMFAMIDCKYINFLQGIPFSCRFPRALILVNAFSSHLEIIVWFSSLCLWIWWMTLIPCLIRNIPASRASLLHQNELVLSALLDLDSKHCSWGFVLIFISAMDPWVHLLVSPPPFSNFKIKVTEDHPRKQSPIPSAF